MLFPVWVPVARQDRVAIVDIAHHGSNINAVTIFASEPALLCRSRFRRSGDHEVEAGAVFRAEAEAFLDRFIDEDARTELAQITCKFDDSLRVFRFAPGERMGHISTTLESLGHPQASVDLAIPLGGLPEVRLESRDLRDALTVLPVHWMDPDPGRSF